MYSARKVRSASKTWSFIRGHVTEWPQAVAATAWGHSVTCPEMNDKVFDAIRTFRRDYIDQGPENVP